MPKEHNVVTSIRHHLKSKGGLKEKSHFEIVAKVGDPKKVIVKFVHDDHRSKHEERIKELAATEKFELEFGKLAAA